MMFGHTWHLPTDGSHFWQGEQGGQVGGLEGGVGVGPVAGGVLEYWREMAAANNQDGKKPDRKS